jgi:hypothetical protein
LTPSAAAMRLSDATLAFARPRSTWLRKLSDSSKVSDGPEPLADVYMFCFSGLRVHRRKLKRHYSWL